MISDNAGEREDLFYYQFSRHSIMSSTILCFQFRYQFGYVTWGSIENDDSQCMRSRCLRKSFSPVLAILLARSVPMFVKYLLNSLVILSPSDSISLSTKKWSGDGADFLELLRTILIFSHIFLASYFMDSDRLTYYIFFARRIACFKILFTRCSLSSRSWRKKWVRFL